MWSTEDVERARDELAAAHIKRITWPEIEAAIEGAKKFRIDDILVSLHKQCIASTGVAFVDLLKEYFREDVALQTKGICEEATSHEDWLASKHHPLYLPPGAKIESGEAS